MFCKRMALWQCFLEAEFHLRSTVDKLSLKWQEMNFSRLSRFANIFHNNISLQHIVITKSKCIGDVNCHLSTSLFLKHFQKEVHDFFPIQFYLKRNLCFWFLMIAIGWCYARSLHPRDMVSRKYRAFWLAYIGKWRTHLTLHFKT